jgi:arginine-tRNA-protein transferase
MFAQVHCPETLLPEELDDYLEQGWFRMGQNIFTTNFLSFRNQFYSAVWLRVVLRDFTVDKTHRKLLKQNAVFRTEVREAVITPAHETLFMIYKQSVAFEPSASVHALLYGKALHNVFNTRLINVYDCENLIACGVFDMGTVSAAGISCFYDPAYKKYSLGKYMIYWKMKYCQDLGLQYFYPGYFVPGYSFFDYKLDIGKTALQYLQLQTHSWLPAASFADENNPLKIMQRKLQHVGDLVATLGVPAHVMKYEFFEANIYPDLVGFELFDYPVFLDGFDVQPNNLRTVLIYDVRDGLYHLVVCRSVWTSNVTDHAPDTFSSHLLKIDSVIYNCPEPETMAALILARHQVQHNFQSPVQTKSA